MESLESLKASAYDCLAVIERHQIMLREINQKIANYPSKPESVVMQGEST